MDSKVDCICDKLEDIQEFYSIYEFERFQRYVNSLVTDGDLKEVSVEKYYAGFKEQWFMCIKCKQVWRLVHPDFPFKGLWEQVK